MSTSTNVDADWGAVAAAWEAAAADIDRSKDEVTERLLERLAVQPGDRVLELAAGPGSLAPRWSALVGPTGAVEITDGAAGMVEIAARRNASLANVTTAQLDLTAIDRPDASADVVACRMGLMFAPDPAVALGELRRVSAPGARVGVVVWGPLDRNPWMTAVGMPAMIHGLVAGGPPVGPGQIFSLGDPARLADLVAGAGYHDVVVDEVPVTFDAPSVDDHVARVSALAGPMAAVFAAATPDQLAAVRATAAELLAPHTAPDGTVTAPGLALLATAHT